MQSLQIQYSSQYVNFYDIFNRYRVGENLQAKFARCWPELMPYFTNIKPCQIQFIYPKKFLPITTCSNQLLISLPICKDILSRRAYYSCQNTFREVSIYRDIDDQFKRVTFGANVIRWVYKLSRESQYLGMIQPNCFCWLQRSITQKLDMAIPYCIRSCNFTIGRYYYHSI